MLLVILGAGASHDSSPDAPPPADFVDSSFEDARPPVASGLFGARFGSIALDYPPCQALLPDLREVASQKTTAIEATLERLRDQSMQFEHVAQQLMALRYYLRDALRRCSEPWYRATNGQTNYARLLNRIEYWRQRHDEYVTLVTFNYDTILERACEAVLPGFSTGRIEDYIAHPRYKLVKLHGSVDWSRLVPTAGSLRPSEIICRAARIKPGDAYVKGDKHPSPNMSVMPAISIPTMTKTDSDFECPSSHRALLWKSLPKVTRALAIGWRGMEAHFMARWREAILRQDPGLEMLCVVAQTDESAQSIAEHLVSELGLAERSPHLRLETVGGFTRFASEQRLVDLALEM